MTEILPAVRRLRPRPYSRIRTNHPRASIPVALRDNGGAHGRGDLGLGSAGDRRLLERVEPKASDLIRDSNSLDLVRCLDRTYVLETGGEIEEFLGFESGSDRGRRARCNRVRLSVEDGGCDCLERSFESDAPAFGPMPGGEVAEVPEDRLPRRLLVEPDCGEGADLTCPDALCLLGFVLGDDQRGGSLLGNEDEAEVADLEPVTGREQDVLCEAKEERVHGCGSHLHLKLLDAARRQRHAGWSVDICRIYYTGIAGQHVPGSPAADA